MPFTLRKPTVVNHFSVLQPKRTYIRSKFLPPLTTSEEKHLPIPEPPLKPRKENPPPKLLYLVPRDAKGNLPVFCNLKNANTRKVTWLRGVEGNTEALRQDIVETLLPRSTTDPKVLRKLRVNSRVHQRRHIILAGGYWAPKIHAWLVERGF